MTEEFRRGLGYIKDKRLTIELRMHATDEQIAALPSSYILKDPTPVEDQGSLGSCTGNASDNASKIRGAIAGAAWFNGSRLAMYKLARDHDGSSGDVGSTLSSVAWVLENKGIAPETLWPYNTDAFDEEPPQTYMTQAVKDETTQATRLDSSLPQNTINNIKVAVNTGYPVMIGFTVYNSFFDTGSDGNMPAPSGGIAGGHAVCIIGFDDTHANQDGSTGALYIKNSWGSGWGANGYFWMGYQYAMSGDGISDCWAIITESDFNPVPPTPTGVTFASSPAACSTDGTTLDVFVEGSDKACWHGHRTAAGTWTWTSLAGVLTAAPAAVTRAGGLIDVFARGSDSAIWRRVFNGTTWGVWQSLGGKEFSGMGPTAVSRSATSIDLFVIGTDDFLYQRTLTGTTWSAWARVAAKIQ